MGECTCDRDRIEGAKRRDFLPTIEWWCWMFGCPWCVTHKHYCGVVRRDHLGRVIAPMPRS